MEFAADCRNVGCVSARDTVHGVCQVWTSQSVELRVVPQVGVTWKDHRTEEVTMSDTTPHRVYTEQNGPEVAERHQPKHRLEGVPVDAVRDVDGEIAGAFGSSNPDTSLAG